MNAFVRVWVVLCLIIYVSKIHPLSTANVSSSDSAVASSVHMNTFRLLPHSVSVVASFVASSSMNVSRVGSLPTVAPESKMIAALPCPHGISASSSDSAVTSSVHMYTFSGVTLMPICLTLS
ncbi:uncharacterized protein LOC134193946 [Corticium candelabrum]|uniref:uncharacterized protein LOC134193946 n=1 Tax=Corticium candelabrum TaxID=121492 RepID=UPI002E27339E|nr:uncharacterized protein LOC134193946 [Corticium candelabrum]